MTTAYNDGQPATVLFIGGPKDGVRETVPVVRAYYTCRTLGPTPVNHVVSATDTIAYTTEVYAIRQYSSSKGTIWVYLYSGTDETRLMEILLLGYREPRQ